MKQKLSRKMSFPVIRLGVKCNANCSFCNVPAESYSLPENASFDSIKKEITDLTENYAEGMISLSGGEPTLREDLFDIIQFAKKSGVRIVELQTNAILIGVDGYAQKLKKAGLNRAFVSFHSHIPSIHESLLGVKGSFNKCVMGINNLLRANILVTLNPVITTKNFKKLPEYLFFVKKEFPKVKNISLSIVQPCGRAWNNNKLVPRYGKIDSCVKKTLLIGQKLGISIKNPYCGLPLCIGDWWKYPKQCVEISEKLLPSHQIKAVQAKFFSPDSKIKSEQCFFCDVEKYCNGVWKKYAELYSLNDLRPVSLSPKFKAVYN